MREESMSSIPVYLCACCAILALASGCDRPARVDANWPDPKPTPAMPPVPEATAATATGKGGVEPCAIVKAEEIQQIQGATIIDTTSTVVPNEGLQTAQCFYVAEEYSMSVALAITRKDPGTPSERSARDLWDETQRRAVAIPQQIAGRRAPAPEKVEGLGDEACFIRPSSLYVLKGDVFLHVSVSGPEAAEGKIAKSKAIAQKAFERL